MDNEFYLLQLEQEDEVLSCLKIFALENKIASAAIKGIGAIEDLVLGYYDTKERVYLKKSFSGSYEICTLLGNITYLNQDEPIIHLHGVFSDRDYNVIGGHLFGGRISAAGEFFIKGFQAKITRKDTKQDLKPIEL